VVCAVHLFKYPPVKTETILNSNNTGNKCLQYHGFNLIIILEEIVLCAMRHATESDRKLKQFAFDIFLFGV